MISQECGFSPEGVNKGAERFLCKQKKMCYALPVRVMKKSCQPHPAPAQRRKKITDGAWGCGHGLDEGALFWHEHERGVAHFICGHAFDPQGAACVCFITAPDSAISQMSDAVCRHCV